MSHDREDLQEQIDRSTARLLTTVVGLAADDLRQPSLLPGWTRAHVIAHLARGADAMRNLLEWARTGVPRAAYPGAEHRAAAIEEGAVRPADELLADLSAAAANFRAVAVTLTAQEWQVPVGALDGPTFPAAQLLLRRLVELELHHTDLGAGYSVPDWTAAFLELDLPGPLRDQRAERMARSTV